MGEWPRFSFQLSSRRLVIVATHPVARGSGACPVAPGDCSRLLRNDPVKLVQVGRGATSYVGHDVESSVDSLLHVADSQAVELGHEPLFARDAHSGRHIARSGFLEL